MNVHSRRMMFASAALAGGTLLALAPQATASVRPVSPLAARIVANPDNVMVNTFTTLTGTGFPASSTIVLRECGKRSWIAPQNPCDQNNSISVTTDPAGGFTTGFKAELCPRTHVGPGPVTQETCYVGEPKPSGIDTIHLVGAAKIIVTYP